MESALINPIKYIEEIYKRPFMCAGFARRYSEIIITKNAEDKKDEVYHRASAWNFNITTERFGLRKMEFQ